MHMVKLDKSQDPNLFFLFLIKILCYESSITYYLVQDKNNNFVSIFRV